MTMKFTILYPQPEDPAAFDTYYWGTHLGLLDGMPGLQRAEVARVRSTPEGGRSDWYVITELYFADQPGFDAAMGSPQMRAAGGDLRNFAPPGTVAFVAAVE